tara:strand:- start:224 stop:445 length:222 start_codon:yes stop_codon:yes gene_type:complete
MKKVILSAIVVLILLSCSKQKEDSKVCYYCEFSGFIGSPTPPRTVCLEPWEDITKQLFQDGRGNDLSANCKRK